MMPSCTQFIIDSYNALYIWNQYGGQGEFDDNVEQNQQIQQLALSRVF